MNRSLDSTQTIAVIGELFAHDQSARELGATAGPTAGPSALEHALQCATLGERAGASPDLIVAAFLHDLGHLLAQTDETALDEDDLHQYRVRPFLRGVFPESVIVPVMLHVDAKRFLCATQPGYVKALTLRSRTSLRRQGGPFTRAESAEFLRHPYARDAIALRRWDDQANRRGAATLPLAHFLERLREVAIEPLAVAA